MHDFRIQEHGIAEGTVGAGEHLRVVERKLRTVKERLRAIVNTQPFKLCYVLLKSLPRKSGKKEFPLLNYQQT